VEWYNLSILSAATSSCSNLVVSTFHWFQEYLADGKPNVMEHVESCVQSIWALWQSVYFYPFNEFCHAYQACMTTGELRAMAEERGCAAVGRRTRLG